MLNILLKKNQNSQRCNWVIIDLNIWDWRKSGFIVGSPPRDENPGTESSRGRNPPFPCQSISSLLPFRQSVNGGIARVLSSAWPYIGLTLPSSSGRSVKFTRHSSCWLALFLQLVDQCYMFRVWPRRQFGGECRLFPYTTLFSDDREHGQKTKSNPNPVKCMKLENS